MNKNFFLRHKLSFVIAGIIILSAILVACGGGGSEAPSLVAKVTDIVSPSIKQNEGGITYTKENLAGIDTNGDGVDDATANRLNTMYNSQPLVLAAFMQSARLDKELLIIPDDKLPKTKVEASAIIYSTSRIAASCIEGNVLGDNNFEKETLREYFAVFDTPAKRQRFQEIQELAGIQTGTFVSCDEILSTTTSVK